MADEGLTSDELRETFRGLRDLEELGALRDAFCEDHDGVYETLSANALTVISRTAQALVMLERAERKQVADAWAEAWFSDPPRDYVSLPLEVAEFIVRSLGVAEGQAVHCPGGNMDAVAIACMRHNCLPVVESMKAPAVAAIYATIAGSSLKFLRRDPLGTDTAIPPPLEGIEVCIALPSWSDRFDPLTRLEKRPSRFAARTSEALGLEMAAFGPAREVAVVVSDAVLIAAGPVRDLSRELVSQGLLKAVIGFPSGVIIGASQSFSVLRLSRAAPTEGVLFCRIDQARHLAGRGKLRSRFRRFTAADEVLQLLAEPEDELSTAVPVSRIARQNYSLLASSYLFRPITLFDDGVRRAIPLDDVVSIIKPQFLRSQEGADATEIQEAIPGELPEYGYLTCVARTRWVDSSDLKARRQQILEADDVLLSTKGTIGKVGIARPDGEGLPLLPSQASVILRKKRGAPDLDPRFLVMFLRSPAMQQALSSLAFGATIQNIPLSELRSMLVWFATPEEQQPFIEAFMTQTALEAEIRARQAKQNDVAMQVWDSAGLIEKE
jgi:hypothetical protein